VSVFGFGIPCPKGAFAHGHDLSILIINKKSMVLNKTQITQHIKDKDIIFEPALDGFQVQPNSVDLRVGWNFYIPETWKYTDAGRVAIQADYLHYEQNKDYFRLIKLKPGQYFEILPREFIMISTLEKITLNAGQILATMYPRTSVIRRGLIIESGLIDVKYQGHLIIPVFNSTDHYLKLYPGERICQLVFHTLSEGLSEEQALTHGLTKAKYMGSTPHNLEARSDSKQEIDFILEGKLDELKKKFKIL